MVVLKIIGLEHKKKNVLINGNFDFWQRGISFTANGYSADRWEQFLSSTGVLQVARSTDVPTFVQSGFPSTYSMEFSCNTADTGIIVSDIATVKQKIEGYNTASIMGKKAIFSFWVKSNKTGIYSASFSNAGSDRYWTSEFEVLVADVWQLIKISVDFMDALSSGTWDFVNGIGLHVTFTLMAGSGYHVLEEDLDKWRNPNFTASENNVNFMDNIANYMRVSQIRLMEDMFGDDPFQRAGQNIQEELAMCQRYYEDGHYADISHSNTELDHWNSFSVTKRANPAMSTSNEVGISTWSWYQIRTNGYKGNGTTVGGNINYEYDWQADAEL